MENLELVPTTQLYCLYRKPDGKSPGGWMRENGHVAKYSKDNAESFLVFLGPLWSMHPVYLMTPKFEK